MEEQFYLLYPLLILGLYRLGRRWIAPGLAATAVLSFFLAQWMSVHKPAAALFLLPPRAWELLIGSLASALRAPASRLSISRQSNLLSVTALIFLLASFMVIDKGTPWPSSAALVPTLASAVLIVFASPTGWAGRVLASRPMKGIGLVSYSIYLWHQPLFAFARQRCIDRPAPSLMLLLSVASGVLAYLTWRFVESPFRAPRSEMRARTLRYASFASAAVFATAAVANSEIQVVAAGEMTDGHCNYLVHDCFARRAPSYRVAVWGDSFADEFATRLGSELAKQNASLHLFIMHSCPSILGTIRNEPHRIGGEFAAECEEHNLEAIRVMRQQQFDFVVLTSAYQSYIDRLNESGEPVLLDATDRSAMPSNFVSKRLNETIDAVRGTHAQVILLTPYPVIENFDEVRKQLFFGIKTQAYADLDSATRTRSALLSQIPPSEYLEIDGRQFLCRAASCPVVGPKGDLLLYDGAHMSTALATSVAAKIASVLAQAWATGQLPVHGPAD